MKLPALDDLEPEQFAVYQQPAHMSVLVVGPPGSGKTSIAIWRAIFIARQNKRVILVTRSRMLAALAQQMSREGGLPIETTTMQSLVWNDYRQHFGQGPTQAGEYEFPWRDMLQRYEATGVTPNIDHIIVDEGQNLPPEFFAWALRFRAANVSIFADEHQTTLRGGTTMEDLAKMGFQTFFPLTKNHRNSWEIANFVSHFHRDRKLPGAAAQRGGPGDHPRLITVDTWDGLVERIANSLANRSGSIGVITYKQSDVAHVFNLLRARLPGERVDSYTSNMDRGAELISMRDRGVTVISGESAIGLEFNTVFLHDLPRSLPRTSAADNRRLYMLSARARDVLFLVNGPSALTQAQLDDLPPSPDLER